MVSHNYWIPRFQQHNLNNVWSTWPVCHCLTIAYFPYSQLLCYGVCRHVSARQNKYPFCQAQHQAKWSILLTKEILDFIPPTLWPPNSPNLNLADYKVWSVMQGKVYKKPIKNDNELCSHTLAAWDELNQCVTDAALAHTSMCLCYSKRRIFWTQT